jgi:hypothetical protein
VSDQGLAEAVTQRLKLAGLPGIPLDGPGGGFAVQPDEDVIYVVWSPSEELSVAAFEQLERGNVQDPVVVHVGRIKHAMADAMLEILRSAGFGAAMSKDDMAPATVEVRAA